MVSEYVAFCQKSVIVFSNREDRNVRVVNPNFGQPARSITSLIDSITHASIQRFVIALTDSVTLF